MFRSKYKYLVALAAIMLHLGVGSVYAWSVLTLPIIAETGWNFGEVTTVFSVTIAALGFTAAFLGEKVRNWGAKKSCVIATLFFFTGMILSSAAIKTEYLFLLYIAYGVLVGIGTGIAYLTPIPILMTWFPKDKGLATGLVVTGFGFSGTIASFMYLQLIDYVTMDYAMAIAGMLLTLLMLPAIFFLRENPDFSENGSSVSESFNIKSVITNRNFIMLWIVFFINISVGIAVLSALAPITVSLFRITIEEAAAFVAFIAIVNGLSRCFWSWISDYLTRPFTFVAMVIIETVALTMLVISDSYSIYELSIVLLISCYGGMFATMPGYLADLFGISRLSNILGIMLTAWGVAGFIGPKVLTMFEATHSLIQFFACANVVMSISLGITLYLASKTMFKIKS